VPCQNHRKLCTPGKPKSRGQHCVGKLRLYEILYNLNQGFEQVLGQLQLLEKLGLEHQPWKALRVIVEENRAEVNFELVERLAEREERDWTAPVVGGHRGLLPRASPRIGRAVMSKVPFHSSGLAWQGRTG
jgi:hypothetical protein